MVLPSWSDYGAWVALGIVVSAALSWVAAGQYRRRLHPARWAEHALIVLAGAILGGRALYVLLHAGSFAGNIQVMITPSAGGLNWHGALWGGLALSLLYRRFTRQLLPFSLVLSIALPILTVAAWIGCGQSPNAGCAVGREVATLADTPPLVAAELPDVYGLIAPRLNLPLFGALLALVLAIWAGMWRWRERREGANPAHNHELPKGAGAIAVLLLAGGMFLIGFARSDAVTHIGFLRGDQVLDGVTMAGALAWWVGKRRVQAH